MNDMYSVASMLKAIDLMPREENFIWDSFVQEIGAVENDKAIYDFRKGIKQLAPIVHKNVGGVVMDRGGFETREIGFCTIAPERNVELDNISRRFFGENILGAMTPAEREKKMIAQDLKDMRAAIHRRRAWMARQVILTGKLSVFEYTNEGRALSTTMVADYGFTNNFTPTTNWDQAGANIYDDMQRMYDMVYEGLGSVEMVVMAPDVASALLHNDAYMKTMDMRNADMGKITTQYKGQGVRFIGRNADGVEMYSVAEQYEEDDGTVGYTIPSGTIIVGGKGILKCPHGPVTQVEEVGTNAVHKTYIKREVPLRIGSIEGNAIKNRLTSRPTIVPFNVDAWAVGHVL